MNVNSLNPNLKFLNASQLVEAASNLDAIHTRTLKVIARLQSDVDARKRAAAARWKGAGDLMSQKDRQRIEANEVNGAIIEIKRSAEKELDAILKEAGASHSAAVACREFYDSPVKTLNRITLGDPKRSEYMRQVESIGPGELQHLGQFALSTNNAALAAAIVSRLDTMPTASRPFGAVALAQGLNLDEDRKGTEAIKIADVRLQGILVAIRTWKAGSANPLNTVALALRERTLDVEVLKELEADNGDPQ